MGNCPFCGAPFEVGTLVCPSCGNEIIQQTAEPTEEGDQAVDPGQDDTLTGDEGGGGEAEPPLELDSSVPGSEIPPSHGGGVDHSQPPGEEPPEGLTDTKDIGLPHGEVPDRDLSMKGPAVDLTGGVGPSMPSPGADEPAGPPPERRTTRLVFGAFMVIILVIIIAAATFYLMAGDDDGNGNGEPNGEPNGHNGPGPMESLHIDPLETSVDNVWEPVPGFHLDVIILNNATGTESLDGHDLFVTIFVGMDMVGQATEPVSGDLASGENKWVPIDVGVDLTSGQTYKVNVLLRKDGGNTSVDSYYEEVTVE